MDSTERKRTKIRRWMRANVDASVDPTTGEAIVTHLAENAAAAFGLDYIGGPLDDPDHPIWDWAADIAIAHERVRQSR